MSDSGMLLLQNHKNTKLQGNVGMGFAIAWFMEHGFPVSIPITDSQEYDLVADIEGKLCKVQVRTTYCKSPYDRYVVNLRVLGGNRSGTGKVKYFNPAEVDYLFVVTNSREKYLIPSKVIISRSVIALGAKYAPYRVD